MTNYTANMPMENQIKLTENRFQSVVKRIEAIHRYSVTRLGCALPSDSDFPAAALHPWNNVHLRLELTYLCNSRHSREKIWVVLSVWCFH